MGLIIKNGVIYNGAESEPVVYSLDEREVGVWIDGKPLYQKTFVTSNLSSGKTTIAHNLTNIDQIWLDNSATHFISGDNNATTPYYSGGYGDGGAYVDGYVNIVQLNKTNITIKLASSSSIVNGKGYIVISYTKTTDTPGSGMWTPSGAKAEHYSTNEHVVGTWIDGSTVYEKTYEVTNINSDNNIVIDASFTQSAIKLLPGCSAVLQTTGTYNTDFALSVISDDATGLRLFTNVNGLNFNVAKYNIHSSQYGTCSALVTIRYTKTTS